MLRRIAAADEAVEQARRELDDEVATAREAGFSWMLIGLALGSSRQAARNSASALQPALPVSRELRSMGPPRGTGRS